MPRDRPARRDSRTCLDPLVPSPFSPAPIPAPRSDGPGGASPRLRVNRPNFLHQLRIASEHKPDAALLPVHVRMLGSALMPFRVLGAWLFDPARRTWTLPLALTVAGFLLVHPWDAQIAAHVTSLSREIGGDLRRELHAWQQFGALGSIVFVSIVVLALDRGRARRLLDLYLAVAVAGVLCVLMKMGIGRPRPRDHFEDATTFLGPLGVYPIKAADGTFRLVHAWSSRSALRAEGGGSGEGSGGGVNGGSGGGGSIADLWSMPSSHTVYAVVLAAFLIAMYPRLRWLWITLALLVAFCRLLFDAHWASDVIVGAGLGAAVTWTVLSHFLGVRLLDNLWRWLVDPRATPAEPSLRRAFNAPPRAASIE